MSVYVYVWVCICANVHVCLCVCVHVCVGAYHLFVLQCIVRNIRPTETISLQTVSVLVTQRNL